MQEGKGAIRRFSTGILSSSPSAHNAATINAHRRRLACRSSEAVAMASRDCSWDDAIRNSSSRASLETINIDSVFRYSRRREPRPSIRVASGSASSRCQRRPAYVRGRAALKEKGPGEAGPFDPMRVSSVTRFRLNQTRYDRNRRSRRGRTSGSVRIRSFRSRSSPGCRAALRGRRGCEDCRSRRSRNLR